MGVHRDFSRKLALIAEHETHSSEAKLKLGGGKKSLANELKRSAGKRIMMRKLALLSERKGEEVCIASHFTTHFTTHLLYYTFYCTFYRTFYFTLYYTFYYTLASGL